MRKPNPTNERIKYAYFRFLEQAKGYNEASIDTVASALTRFEVHTKHRDFGKFRCELAVAFKARLLEVASGNSGKRLSKATVHAVLLHLKNFFFWLAGQPGFKSQFKYGDSEYFNLSGKDLRIAKAPREKRYPTPIQLDRVLSRMPFESDCEKRDRALFAFAALTGARVKAICSMKLKHIDLQDGSVYSDANEVKTKFAKTFRTFFVPIGPEFRRVFDDWVEFLRKERLWGDDDPLFPATRTMLDGNGQFAVAGLERTHWNTTGPIREIFRQAFARAELPYFYPHTFRDTLSKLGQERCKTPEELKAWSQNIGHSNVMTTLLSYGTVSLERQREILLALQKPESSSIEKLSDQERRMIEAYRSLQLSNDQH